MFDSLNTGGGDIFFRPNRFCPPQTATNRFATAGPCPRTNFPTTSNRFWQPLLKTPFSPLTPDPKVGPFSATTFGFHKGVCVHCGPQSCQP